MWPADAHARRRWRADRGRRDHRGVGGCGQIGTTALVTSASSGWLSIGRHTPPDSTRFRWLRRLASGPGGVLLLLSLRSRVPTAPLAYLRKSSGWPCPAFSAPLFLLPQLLLFVLFLVLLATLVSHANIMPHDGRWMNGWLAVCNSARRAHCDAARFRVRRHDGQRRLDQRPRPGVDWPAATSRWREAAAG